MALKLFEHPLSPYAQKVKLLLYEKGIPFERVFIDPNRPSDDRAHQEFVLASPRREVPALVEGDVRVFDSSIIIDYLEERWPQPSMQPDSPAERARVRMLEEMMDTEYEAVNWGVMEIQVFERATGKRAEELLAPAQKQLQRLWNRLERELAGREWMNGARYGRGDAAVYPHIAGSRAFGFPVTDRFPRLESWQERVAQRSAVKRVAMERAECLRAERAKLGEQAPRVVREYRDHRLEWMMKTGGTDIVVEGLLNGSIRYATEYE